MEKEKSKKINPWQESFRQALTSLEDFKSYAQILKLWDDSFGNHLPLTDLQQYPLFLPRSLAKEILTLGPHSSLWRQFIPSDQEVQSLIQNDGLLDPIGDLKNLQAPQIIHRYPNRALFLPTTVCPVQCRFCFRKNELHVQPGNFLPDWSKTLQYLKIQTQIEEIIFTGGDPLMLSDNKIHFYLTELSQLKHINFIRFHTRMPLIIPERIDQDFLDLMDKFSNRFTFSIMLHTNHRQEWFLPAHDQMLSHLKRFPGHVATQTVLLKNINQEADLVELFKFLIKNKIRPYYLHHPDKVKGAMHFNFSLEEGKQIYRNLRNQLPGWAIPHYVQDSDESSQKKLVLEMRELMVYNNTYEQTSYTH